MSRLTSFLVCFLLEATAYISRPVWLLWIPVNNLSEFKNINVGQAPVAHVCNPSYSGGRDQEDCSSKPAWEIFQETVSRKYLTQKGLVEWLKV
jgi:hypothetical protein